MAKKDSPGDFMKAMASSKPGDVVECKRCGKTFKRPFWFFEGLCDECFRLFDIAKMKGRFGGVRMENSDEWMKEMPHG